MFHNLFHEDEKNRNFLGLWQKNKQKSQTTQKKEIL
jgi:hypothetical protein